MEEDCISEALRACGIRSGLCCSEVGRLAQMLVRLSCGLEWFEQVRPLIFVDSIEALSCEVA